MPPVVSLVPKGQEVVEEDPELRDFLQQVNQLQADMAKAEATQAVAAQQQATAQAQLVAAEAA